MSGLNVVEVRGIRVLTTRQIADAYEVAEKLIRSNFENNKKRYEEGKHYIWLKGEELKEFLHTQNLRLQNQSKIRNLYLWTEKGALLHAKSLNTDKAWQVYDYLVDFYFRTKEDTNRQQAIVPVRKLKHIREVVNVPENPVILNEIKKVQEDLTCMNVLLEDCKGYTSREDYRTRIRNAAQVVTIIIGDMNTLMKEEPKLIQKEY